MNVFAKSDVGMCREQNQDSFYFSMESCGELPNIFLVADGMGGHSAGEVASQYTAQQLPRYIAQSDKTFMREIFTEAIKKVSNDIEEMSRKNPKQRGMGTTLVAVTVLSHSLCVVNIGDSRAYLLQDGKLKQMTKDHSLVEEMVAQGKIKRHSRIYEEYKNIITRAIGGVKDNVDPDFFQYEWKENDIILLCSDGLSNMLSDDYIEAVLKQDAQLEEKTELLVNAANLAGGFDNITALLIQVGGEVN